jgi:thioesterase domain-containing protein
MGSADDRVAALSPHRQSLLRQLQASRAQAAQVRDHPAVPMRAGDSPVQLVLLHAAGGELFCYAPLVRSLPPGTAVTGFPADPADNDLPLDGRVVEVARRTLAALAREHDLGRCVLAGWSYGGALAFEMARQHALATGMRLPVALLDCLYYGDVELEDEATVRRRFVYDVARMAGGEDDQVTAALEAVDASTSSLPRLLALAGADISLTGQEIEDRYLLFRACSLSLQLYRPPAPYDGPVTVAAADGPERLADYMGARWRAVCTGPFAHVRLPGDHYTLFTPPALAAVTGVVVSVMRDLTAAAAGAGAGQGK